jgi:peptidyl-prolyl cis-trans isomerase A (cyclophilin A)
MKRAAVLLILILLISCGHKKYDNPHILIETGYGDIEAELYPAKAPKTVAAFLSYIDAGYYKDASFYRVLKDDDMPTDYNSGIIQGGVWPKDMKLPGIEHESTKQTGLSHTSGTLSLARSAVNTATTEFFICIGDRKQLDAGSGGTPDSLGYAAFGRVVHGMDIVRQIQAVNSTGDHFVTKITINNIKRL